jgi:hypothetical protein
MNMAAATVYELAGGDLEVWAEVGGPVMLKFVTATSTDPIELGEGEVAELIEVLLKLNEAVSRGE